MPSFPVQHQPSDYAGRVRNWSRCSSDVLSFASAIHRHVRRTFSLSQGTYLRAQVPKAAAIPVARRHLHDHSFKVISRVFRVMFLQNRDDLANVNDPLLQEHIDIGFGEVTHGETTFKDAGQLTQFVILPRTTGRQTEANRS